jgi:phosphate-selective porin OprO/OprP
MYSHRTLLRKSQSQKNLNLRISLTSTHFFLLNSHCSPFLKMHNSSSQAGVPGQLRRRDVGTQCVAMINRENQAHKLTRLNQMPCLYGSLFQPHYSKVSDCLHKDTALMLKLLLLFIAILLPALTVAQPAETRSILLRNVTLVDPDTSSNKTVNILVKGATLDIMTEDTIPIDDADESYNAMGGFILGNLKLGGPASFMILDGNPRVNMDILLDTKKHVTFAMKEGDIVRNRFLIMLEETPAEKKRAEAGWLAYAPPPLAVPLDYTDTSKWNRFDTKFISGIAAGAIVLDRQNSLDQNNASLNQVGDLESYDGGEIRALRFGGVGTINLSRPWIWTLFGATHAFDKGFDTQEDDQFTLFDVRLDIPVWEKASISIGKQKEPISMERIMSMVHLPMQERSAVADALLPSRNVGLVMAGTLFDDRVALAGGAFNDWLDKDQPNSFSDNATQYVGRATWVPYQSENQSTLLHLGLGARYSTAEEGGQISSEPEFNQSPLFIDSGVLDPDQVNTYQAEASLRSGPFWLHGEYIQSQIDSPELGDPTSDGYHITASWVATGEVRPYNHRVGVFKPVPIARTVHQNGWGAWEFSTRYSTLNASDQGLQGGDMDIWSAGINWWLTPYMNVNMNYRYITLDKGGEEGTSQGMNTRLVLVLE